MKQQSRKRKRGDEKTGEQEDKLKALRERLREIKAQKAKDSAPNKKAKTSAKSKPSRRDGDNSDSDDSSNDDAHSRPHARSSKHAPAVMSSKKAVTRRREIVETKKPAFRDPRFDSAIGPKPDDHTMKKRYGFINEYKDSEMAELRAVIKKTKNEDEKEKLKRKLMSMESQKKARERKEREQKVISEHKKKEKEAIKEGKQPFYLKKCASGLFHCLGPQLLTLMCSRAKEDCPGGSLPEYEGQGPRARARTQAQKGRCKGEEEHAHGQERAPAFLSYFSCWRCMSLAMRRLRCQIRSTIGLLSGATPFYGRPINSQTTKKNRNFLDTLCSS